MGIALVPNLALLAGGRRLLLLLNDALLLIGLHVNLIEQELLRHNLLHILSNNCHGLLVDDSIFGQESPEPWPRRLDVKAPRN